MDEIWNELVEWHEHEAANGEPWVGKLKELRVRLFILEDQQIEIDRTWSHRHIACATQRILNSQQSRQRLLGRGKCRAAQLRHHVQKRRLIFILDRLGFKNARESNNIQSGVEHSTHC